jgi:hypothetical protein
LEPEGVAAGDAVAGDVAAGGVLEECNRLESGRPERDSEHEERASRPVWEPGHAGRASLRAPVRLVWASRPVSEPVRAERVSLRELAWARRVPERCRVDMLTRFPRVGPRSIMVAIGVPM